VRTLNLDACIKLLLDGHIQLCLNYVQGGTCLIDTRKCLLGRRGNQARNQDHECPRHGPFDVWRTREDSILISDLGGPYEGVKDCYGLGMSLQEATRIARNYAFRLAVKIVTTQRRCGRCGVVFWPRADLAQESALDRVPRYFCPSCAKAASKRELEEFRRQMENSEGTLQSDLNEWCG
jgi:hypothetical protein